MDLLYINSDFGSVFESQVLELLECLNKFPEIDKVILLCGYRNNVEKEKIMHKTASITFQIKYFKIFPNYPVFNTVNRISIFIGLLGCPIGKNTIVHIRGEILAMLTYYPLMSVGISVSRILVDVRGVNLEEISEFSHLSKSRMDYKIKNIVKSIKFLTKFSAISAVSKGLKEYLNQKTSISLDTINVVPCLSGLKFENDYKLRNKLRGQIGLVDEECLFVFSSGGTVDWQRNESIMDIANKGYKVLNLSQVKIIHSNVINKFVPYNLMSGYLSAADIAILIRDKSIVNKVASPVKFSEYVCSGLPVISDGNIDMVIDYIGLTGHGLILNSLSELVVDDIIYLRSLSKKAIMDAGMLIFSSEIISKTYFSMYQKMLSSK